MRFKPHDPATARLLDRMEREACYETRHTGLHVNGEDCRRLVALVETLAERGGAQATWVGSFPASEPQGPFSKRSRDGFHTIWAGEPE